MSYLQVLLNKKLNEIFQIESKEKIINTLKELSTSYPYFHYAAAIMSEQDIKDIANVDDKEILLPYFNRVITTSDIKYKTFNSRSVTYPFKCLTCLSNFYYNLMYTYQRDNNVKHFTKILSDFFKKGGYVEHIYNTQLKLNKGDKSYFHKKDEDLLKLVEKVIGSDKRYDHMRKLLDKFQVTMHRNLEVLILELYAIKQLKLTIEIINDFTSNLNIKGLNVIEYDVVNHQNVLIDNLFNNYLYSVFKEYLFGNSFKGLSDDDTEVLDKIFARTIEVLDYYEVKTTNKLIKKIRSFVETVKDFN